GRGDPDRGERDGRGLRRGPLWRRALDQGRPIHREGPHLASRGLQPDREHQRIDDRASSIQRELQRDGEGRRLVDRRCDDRGRGTCKGWGVPGSRRPGRDRGGRHRADRPEARERRRLRDELPSRRDATSGLGRGPGGRGRGTPPRACGPPRAGQRRRPPDHPLPRGKRDRGYVLSGDDHRHRAGGSGREGGCNVPGGGFEQPPRRPPLGPDPRGSRDARPRHRGRPPSAATSADLRQRIIRRLRRFDDVSVADELLWRENKIIVSTPQVIRNDLRSERISLDDVSLIVFDEAHRAVGDYAYVDVAAASKEVRDRLVLGMTASPGSSAEKILEVCSNLGIVAVEIRTEYDPDVVPYLHDLDVERIRVEAPDVAKEIRGLVQTVFDEQVERLKKVGFLAGKPKVSLKDLLAAGDEARRKLDS